jgi:hypothetical protein
VLLLWPGHRPGKQLDLSLRILHLAAPAWARPVRPLPSRNSHLKGSDLETGTGSGEPPAREDGSGPRRNSSPSLSGGPGTPVHSLPPQSASIQVSNTWQQLWTGKGPTGSSGRSEIPQSPAVYLGQLRPGLAEQYLLPLDSRRLVAFEITGRGGSIWVQFVSISQAAPNLVHQLRSHYSQVQAVESPDYLSQRPSERLLARSYRLRDSHLFQIRVEPRLEPLVPLLGVLAHLKAAPSS